MKICRCLNRADHLFFLPKFPFCSPCVDSKFHFMQLLNHELFLEVIDTSPFDLV
ncbi:hypothetical protein SLEP1_g22339 [Rubroshorea leprosula]|uniref:Maturase K n=1 Tax=Rubroshorea leprosula TaxID=152421 RepID=A0AAV5JEY5_9ROSI|nr:hypothetical protein SLEP1_g22339 [Rubroshorea leprosula]